MFKFQASADNKFGLAEIKGFVFERVENIVGKGENAGYQHFLLFPQCFQKASSCKKIVAEGEITFYEEKSLTMSIKFDWSTSQQVKV